MVVVVEVVLVLVVELVLVPELPEVVLGLVLLLPGASGGGGVC